jgi:hypothetical protein
MWGIDFVGRQEEEERNIDLYLNNVSKAETTNNRRQECLEVSTIGSRRK